MSSHSVQQETALRTARFLISVGNTPADVLVNPAIQPEFRDWVAQELEKESNRTFEKAKVIATAAEAADWLDGVDRNEWYYWPTLRSYLLGVKNRPRDSVASLDDASDTVLRHLRPPSTPEFDVRGLVLGYVQSGKTANFAAVIAKAADAGYRLIIVMSGIDNGLRRQTQIRLSKELTGYPHNPHDAVPMPPSGKQWHKFTNDDFDGDFEPGRATHAALQGSDPVLLVVKKNWAVLKRLKQWLITAPIGTKKNLPVLFIDDEADQASVDSKASIQTEASYASDNLDYESPAVINGYIRELLQIFSKRAYVGYTATPFANILIPHEQYDPVAGLDLYPKDFFIDLPKPKGYFGTEEFFGRFDPSNDERVLGLPVLRAVDIEQIVTLLEDTQLTDSMDEAMAAFVLGGAARALRGQQDSPCTMLVHATHINLKQGAMREMIESRWRELKDEWRYNRKNGLVDRFNNLWNEDFILTSEKVDGCPVHKFEDLIPYIGKFMEAVEVREINSAVGDVLDYEKEPSLKAIAIGGNKLSRGLTLEGLLVSYFARRSPQYDTLLQMARWYGYRLGYQDLTRIYSSGELLGWFADLALVEHRLREDMEVYQQIPGITPKDVGMRILRHPAMKVTGSAKLRGTTITVESESYSLQLEQTIHFPLQDLNRLGLMCERNRLAVIDLINKIGLPVSGSKAYAPMWSDVSAAAVVEFLRDFDFEFTDSGCVPRLMADWIEEQNQYGGLVNWTVVVRGRETMDKKLGSVKWLPSLVGPVHNIARTRMKGSNSLGVITTAGDEAFGLTDEQLKAAENLMSQGGPKSLNRAARMVRDSSSGLLVLYPISRQSGYDEGSSPAVGSARAPLFDKPNGGEARDLIGFALSFPVAVKDRPASSYVQGTAKWAQLI
ncbi:Z1 domain-containing protein [Acidovorax radicis]|uniref:Z1 domain-containing protein n=1 Tax=Acidovorax radicis TaxID=758826 RepID=UPI00023765DD|nr:Z1 domain-containing protein [Acidovorax radicis]